MSTNGVVRALIRAIDVPQIFRSGKAVSGGAVVESRPWPDGSRNAALSTEAAQLVDCRQAIAAATSADLRRIFAQRFRPDQVILVAVGDFDEARMMEMVKAKFGAWKAPGEPPIPVLARPSSTPDHAVFVVARPGSVQTTLELGSFGPLRGDPDYEPAEVANAI